MPKSAKTSSSTLRTSGTSNLLRVQCNVRAQHVSVISARVLQAFACLRQALLSRQLLGDALRALGFKVPYSQDGPFFVLGDGRSLRV